MMLSSSVLSGRAASSVCEAVSSVGETGSPVYRRGITFLESAFPPAPEAASAVKYADIPFLHSTGAAMLEIPFYTLKGKELSVPVGLAYVSNGIKLDEIAGVAGLGWTLEAGGCVTRTVMDMPDEFKSGIMSHQLPSDELLAKLDDPGNRDTEKTNYLTKIIRHRLDSRLDRYSYNVCGLSGSFVIMDDGQVFQLCGSGVDIRYTRDSGNEITSFTITGPDGTIYLLSETERGTHDGTEGRMPDIISGEQDKWEATTAWYLSSITSRSGLEQAVFSYESGGRWEKRQITKSTTATISDKGDSPLSYSSASSTIVQSYQTKKLVSVTLDGETVRFYYKGDTGSGLHQGDVVANYPVMLSYATVSDINGRVTKRLEFGTVRDVHDGRITLNSLTFKGLGGQIYDKWSFVYDTRTVEVSHYAQDWYGYYNAAAGSFMDYAPYHYSGISDGTPAPGTPDAAQASYMSLVGCNHNGADTRIVYEGNAIGDTGIGIRVKSIISGSLGASDRRIRSFRYEGPFADGPQMPVPHMYTTVSTPFTSSDMNSGSVTWSFTRHETPVVKGPSVRDTRVYYGKVSETLSFAEISFTPKMSQTIRYYETSKSKRVVTSVSSRFPESARSKYKEYPPAVQGFDPYEGIHTEYTDEGPVCAPVLIRQEEYAGDGGGTMQLVSATDYKYDDPSGAPVLVDYIAQQAWHPSGIGNINYDYIFHYPVYANNLLSRQKVSETHIQYHADGSRDSCVIKTVYLPRTSTLEMPSRAAAVSIEEGGKIRKTSYTYADGLDKPYATTLKNQRYLAVPVSISYSIGNVPLIHYPGKNLAAESSKVAIDLGPVLHPNDTIAFLPDFPAYKTEVIEFGYSDSLKNTLLPSAHIEYVDGKEAWREDILSRDTHGNIVQFKEKGKPNTVILWGYGGKYPVAAIENATLTEVTDALGRAGSADMLRDILPRSHICTFTFDPGIGMTSATDASGVRNSFEYDFAGRLAAVKDTDGNLVREYVYDLLEEQDGDGLLSISGRIYRSADGSEYSEDKSWWNTMGLKQQDISMAAAGDGRDLVTAYESDYLLHDDVKSWLPFPVPDTGGDYQTLADKKAAAFHGNSKAYFYKGYEQSGRDKVIATALPGYEGEHENTWSDCSATAFPKYTWGTSGISGGNSIYMDWEIVKTVNTDADGRIQTIFKDHAGRILGTSYGEDDPTYYIYDSKDRLSAVASSGIEATDTLSMWRYSYDSIGRLSSKGIPGSIREHYRYDGEDRVISVLRGAVLKEFEYDSFGRILCVYVTMTGNRRDLTEEHFYDAYPSTESISPILTEADSWDGPTKNLETYSRIVLTDGNGDITGYARTLYLYDSKARPAKTVTMYPDGGILRKDLTYDFSGNITVSTVTYSKDGRTDTFTATSDYDLRGRTAAGTSTLTAYGCSPVSVNTSYHYDVLGRPCGSTTLSGETERSSSDTYTLQGWLDGRHIFLNGESLFDEILCYDNGDVPSYTGFITKRQEGRNGVLDQLYDEYRYDYAGRLSRESKTGGSISGTAFNYDGRGNMVSVNDMSLRDGYSQEYSYTGDILNEEKVSRRGLITHTYTFAHDSLGRMTFDGRSGLRMEYNHMDLPSRISSGISISVNYSYLADGTKTSSLTESGEGLVYRGPFSYRRSADGSLTLESVVCSEGRLTPDKALLYATDHLGSVRTVIDGSTGDLLECSDYSAYGTRSIPAATTASSTAGSAMTFRDHFTGQEDQMPDFNVPYSDHGARLYNPAIRRWMTPDPLSEKYYGLSVYGYCAGNPVNFVDLDGRFFETLWDVANVTMDIHSLIQNIKDGKIISAIVDGISLTVDGVAAATPFIPGGLGTIVKTVRGADKAIDALNIVDTAADINKATDAVKDGNKIVNSSKYGSYTITFESGMKYHGKGPQKRMEQSARKQAIDHTDNVVSKRWEPSASEAEAFMDEARRIRKDKGVGEKYGNYNKINSPGEKMLKQKGE